MATTAYTSTQAMAGDPPGPQVDAIIDLSAGGGPLPVASVGLFGAAKDSDAPGAVFTWAWSIVDKPSGSAAAIVAPANQNTSIGPIDVWGNYRVKLVATSSGPGGASEADNHEAPATAFVNIRVGSVKKGIQKPANFERGWKALIDKWADKIEASGASDVVNLIDLADVNTATGPRLDDLVDGGYPDDTVPGSGHKHKGASIDVATTTDLGVVKLSDAPADPLNPKAINQDRQTHSAFVDGTPTAQGYKPGQITVAGAVAGVRPHCVFYFKDAVEIEKWSVALGDGGLAAASYGVRLYAGSPADFAAGTMTEIVGSLVTLQPASDNAPVAGTATGPWSVTADRYVGVVVTSAPPTLGGQMSVSVVAVRKV